MEQLNSGDLKDNLLTYFLYCPHWSDDRWKKSMAGGGGNKKNSSVLYWFIRSNLVPPSSSSSFRTQSHWSCFTWQCCYSEQILPVHLHCRMCNQFAFHNQFWIDTGRLKFELQTEYSFWPVDPLDKEHKDPDTIELNAPRHAHTCIKHGRNIRIRSVYWVDINLALKKGLKFYQTRSNAIILHETLPAYCIPKVVWMETGEVIYEKVYASPRPPPKISLKHDWMKELGSEFARQPRRSCSTIQKFPVKPNQIQTQIMIERGNPLFALKEEQENRPVPRRSKHVLFMKKLWNMIERRNPLFAVTTSYAQGASQTLSSHVSKNFKVEDETNHGRTGNPVVCRDTKSRAIIVKRGWHRLQNTRIATLLLWNKLRTIVFVNSLRRSRTTQIDMLFNKIYDKTKPTILFSAESKRMIQDVGNEELFEFCSRRTLRRSAKQCLSYWREGIVYCTCGPSLERKWSQSRSHPIYIGPSFNSKLRDQGGTNLMATDMGKLQKRKNNINPRIWKRGASRGTSKGSTIAFWENPEFRASQLEQDRDEEVCLKWTILQRKISLITWRNQNIFDTNRIGGSLSISLETLDQWEIVLTFNEALSTLNRLHQESGRTTTQASAILEVLRTAPIIEFFLQLVAMQWFLLVIIIQKSRINEDACKDLL